MFGYIAPLKSELRVREYEVYNAYYCAICRAVKRRYGEAARLMLSYDAVLVAMLADALAEAPVSGFKAFRCFNNPFKKRNEKTTSPGVEYAADVMVLLGWLSLRDSRADRDAGNALKAAGIFTGEVVVKKAGKRAAERLGEVARVCEECTEEQRALEAAKTESMDRAADPTGRLMAEVMRFTGSRELGYHLGRYIYIIDAIDDLEKDRARGAYNPLLLRPVSQGDLKTAVTLDLAKVGEALSGLQLGVHKSIIENIVYLGLHARADEALGIKPDFEGGGENGGE